MDRKEIECSTTPGQRKSAMLLRKKPQSFPTVTLQNVQIAFTNFQLKYLFFHILTLNDLDQIFKVTDSI